MRHSFIKATLVALTCFLATQAMAQQKYISTRQQMDKEIFAQAEDLRQSAQPKKKKKAKKVSVYSSPKKLNTKKRSRFSNDIDYAMATTGAGASQNSSNTLMATDSKISTKLEKPAAAPADETKFGGSVGLTIGRESDFTIDRQGVGGSFFEIAPGLNYDSKHFGANFGARIKDFTNQEYSDEAKETEATVGLAGKFDFTDNIKSTTKFDFLNSDSRWPDFFNDSLSGMPIRYFQSKLTQTIGMTFNTLSIDLNGSVTNRDYSSVYSDFAPDILGARIYDRDFLEEQADARVAVTLGKTVTVAARPVFKHRKYSNEPSRQTDGTKCGTLCASTTPQTETMTSEMNADLIFTLGPVGITPTATVGQDSDRALGAWDTAYSGGKLAVTVDIDKDTGLKFTSSVEYKDIKYDNWTRGVTNLAFRHDTENGATAGLAVNLTKAVALGVNYSKWQETSNIPDIDENYTDEIVGSTITVSF